MKVTIAAILSLAALVVANPMPQNAGRPVPSGACCTANTSLKQDVCTLNGASGRCVPSGSANCGGTLTCVADADLTCDANTLERGRPLCRKTGEAGV
ncbi:hypothetical protein P280DRAFT_489505 [Massarina eburnea CBS 473.64]|uniref:Extracellular membrane protein CFEM domain-containing protein n=1 Tax=Massarina eburnea CBS 473.64 TaxID=1395130 RepID=A0A6A6S1J9_9PLEO|nr:hypothetical protein P280DRAFT_489505 [Massarina eburnea CBS 473.64]